MLARSKSEDNPANESCEYEPHNDNEHVRPASRNLHFILVLQREEGGEDK
jgi:hypothetical protein